MADLVNGQCAVPFGLLGLHSHPEGKKGLVIRAWRPDAARVEVIDAASGKDLGVMERTGEGVFELHLPRKTKHFLYQLKVHWANGHQS